MNDDFVCSDLSYWQLMSHIRVQSLVVCSRLILLFFVKIIQQKFGRRESSQVVQVTYMSFPEQCNHLSMVSELAIWISSMAIVLHKQHSFA